LQLGVPHETLKTWAKRYRHECDLYELIGELPRPNWYYAGYAVHITRPTIRMFNAVRHRLIASGMDEMEATHKAADDAVAKCRAIAQARRKVKREAKYGPDVDRFPCRITKRDAERIARTVRAEWGRLRIEKLLKEQGYSRKEIAEMLPDIRAKETTAALAIRKGWSAERASAVADSERTALETVRRWYGARGGWQA
jgi:hypothetical protein